VKRYSQRLLLLLPDRKEQSIVAISELEQGCEFLSQLATAIAASTAAIITA
jgi:hypothetical protein